MTATGEVLVVAVGLVVGWVEEVVMGVGGVVVVVMGMG